MLLVWESLSLPLSDLPPWSGPFPVPLPPRPRWSFDRERAFRSSDDGQWSGHSPWGGPAGVV
eukprot:10525845-Heterocapsa_arctica.AAC.1